MFQILNRTNNIFELVTVYPILNDRPSERTGDIILSDEMDTSEDRNLRLKGNVPINIPISLSLSEFALFDLFCDSKEPNDLNATRNTAAPSIDFSPEIKSYTNNWVHLLY